MLILLTCDFKTMMKVNKTILKYQTQMRGNLKCEEETWNYTKVE